MDMRSISWNGVFVVQYNSIYYSGFPDCGALSRICSFYSELGSQKWETTSFARNGGRVYTSLMTGNAGILSNLYIAFSGRIVRCASLLPVTQRWGVWFSMIWYCTNNNTNNNTTLQHSVITATFLSKSHFWKSSRSRLAEYWESALVPQPSAPHAPTGVI